MGMAQLSGRNSLRDVVGNVNVQAHCLYHLGSAKLARPVCLNVARMNENKPDSLYACMRRYLERRIVTRLKLNARNKVIDHHAVQKNKGIISDQAMIFIGNDAAKKCQTPLRRIVCRDQEPYL